MHGHARENLPEPTGQEAAAARLLFHTGSSKDVTHPSTEGRHPYCRYQIASPLATFSQIGASNSEITLT